MISVNLLKDKIHITSDNDNNFTIKKPGFGTGGNTPDGRKGLVNIALILIAIVALYVVESMNTSSLIEKRNSAQNLQSDLAQQQLELEEKTSKIGEQKKKLEQSEKLIEKIKAQRPETIVIAMSGISGNEGRENIASDFFIVKPASIEDIVDVLTQIVEQDTV